MIKFPKLPDSIQEADMWIGVEEAYINVDGSLDAENIDAFIEYLKEVKAYFEADPDDDSETGAR